MVFKLIQIQICTGDVFYFFFAIKIPKTSG